MRPVFLVSLCFTLLTTEVIAQRQGGRISGTITDFAKHYLIGATIELRLSQDTCTRRSAISRINGGFSFTSLQNGRYILKISYIGLTPYTSAALTLDDVHKIIVLPLIVLQSTTRQELKTVIVSTKKFLIEQKIDRTIVNVDAMISAAGSNALEVLAKSLGVLINSNDDISLNGKSNVLVLIDDRATYMSAQSLAAYLRSLPAGMVEKLELISNPPARYDANGNAIINIVLKKNQAAGFNGSVNLDYSQGVYARDNASMNLNYRTSKFNAFGNAGYTKDKNFNDQSFDRFFYYNNGSFQKQISQSSFFRYQSNAWNGRVGMDFFTSSKTTLGFILTGSTRPRSDLLTYSTNQYKNSIQPDSVGKGYTSGRYKAQNAGFNFNLQHKFDDNRKMLAVNLDAITYHNDGNQYSPIDIYLSNGLLASHQQRFFTQPSDVQIYALKADYSSPLPGKAQIDAGFKSSYVITTYESNWFDQRADSLLQDYRKSNDFRYVENINSAYVTAKKEWPRWAIQAGLRLESTFADGRIFANIVTRDSAFNKNYINLFPSLFLLYKLDSSGNNSIALNFSRRVRRPSYQQLNPFLSFQDVYSYNAGNTALVPSFAQFAELRYNYKGNFSLTLSYGGGKNGINPITQSEGDVFVTRPLNYIDATLLGIIPFASFQPVKWWTFNINAVLLWQRITGSAPGVSINQHANTHEIETNSQIKISNTWSGELSGFFPGRQTYGQSSNSAIYKISAGLQKKTLHGEGTIRFTVNNIFNSLTVHSQLLGINGVQAFNTRVADERRIGLSFIYNFGKAANAQKRNDSGSAEDEKGRTN